MFEQIELFSVGLAAVVDTVLLLVLLERRNWPFVATPILMLVLGAWLWHCGAFVSLLLGDMSSQWARDVHWFAMIAMAAGLLLIPSALVHGCWRLWRQGLETRGAARPLYLTAYLPLLMLWPVGRSLARDPSQDFLELTGEWVAPYTAWLVAVDLSAAATFYLLRARLDVPRARQFFSAVAVALVALAGIQSFVLFYALGVWPNLRREFSLLVVLCPTALALLFAYFVVRFNFMRLVLERTIVYGAVLVLLLLFHRVAVQDWTDALEERFRIDFGIVEGVAALAIIIAFQPLRQRASEALRYLMGWRVAELRERLRALSPRLAEHAGRPPRDVLGWFLAEGRAALEVEYAVGWLARPGGDVDEAECVGAGPDVNAARLAAVFDELRRAGVIVWTPRNLSLRVELLHHSDAALAVRLDHADVRGLIVLGRRPRNREFGEEETNAVLLLCEQLAVTLHSGRLQLERLAAERRALEQEKLSTLGLVAGSIAHEVKNPLSSIKTIAAVLAEQLGLENPHAEDLRLILGEVDRLTTSTSRLLAFARPADGASGPCDVGDALRAIAHIMRHVAARRATELAMHIADDDLLAQADENAVREILFNLLGNAIEACGEGGRVTVDCRRENGFVVADVADTGPGVPPEIQDRLFEPFVSTKPTGTGLGLYVVGRRMRELGGEIHCSSESGRGARFTVKLPVAHPQAPGES